MIGKGRFFDIISRTADDINDPNKSIGRILDDFLSRKAKFNNLFFKNKNNIN